MDVRMSKVREQEVATKGVENGGESGNITHPTQLHSKRREL
jgi:hypothetical protein